MSTLGRALPALWRRSFAMMIQYRGEIALWAIWGIVYPAVALAMWTAAAQAASADGRLKGFDREDFAAYFLLTMIVGHVCTAWDVYEMGWLVRSGRLSPALLRPILPLWSSLADNVGYKVVTLVILVPIWLGVAWATQPRFATTLPHLLLGIPAVILGASLNFLMGYNVALVAFWTTRTDAAAECWFGCGLLLGGRVAPLALLPAPLQWVAAALPFKWVLWFPTEVLIGRLSIAETATGLLCQVAWLTGGVLIFRRLWPAGLRRYSAVGA